jgi:DNA-binding XRE family transcriptional regulator
MKYIGLTSNGNHVVEINRDELEIYLSCNDHKESVGSLRAAVRSWRKDNKLSQEDVSDRLGISRNYYSQIELGTATNYSHQIYVKILALMESPE